MSYRADKQVIDTHTLTDTQTGAMTIPEGQNWPRVKRRTIPLFNWSLPLFEAGAAKTPAVNLR